MKENSNELPKRSASDPTSSTGTVTLSVNPRKVTGIAITSPASGPAMPTSKRALRFGARPRITITAPSVPKILAGNGRKKGKLAPMPLRRHMTKWPSSWVRSMAMIEAAYTGPPAKKVERSVSPKRIAGSLNEGFFGGGCGAGCPPAQGPP